MRALFSERLVYLIAILGLGFNSVARAQNFKFVELTSGDFARMTDDLSADFTHTSVSGHSTLGHLFGFELGIVGLTTKTPNLDRLVRSADSDASLRSLPGAELVGALSVPFGLTVELAGLPRVGTPSFHLHTYTLGVKWTISDLFSLPFGLALKAQSTQAHVDAHQEVNGVNANYDYDGWIHGLTLLAGYDFKIVAPYVGLGLLHATGDMKADGVAAFAPQYTSNDEGTATRGSAELLVGAEVKLFVIKAGLEYARLFATERWAGKLAFYF